MENYASRENCDSKAWWISTQDTNKYTSVHASSFAAQNMQSKVYICIQKSGQPGWGFLMLALPM